MFKTYFKYGTMNCGKSTELLSNAHNYKTKGVATFLMTPAKDDRSGVGYINSRIGLRAKADFVVTGFNQALQEFLQATYEANGVLFLDECQFLSYATVRKIVDYCHYLEFQMGEQSNFCLLAYGLLTDFNHKLFDGSKAWVEVADSIHEIKTVCFYCNRKATCNLLKPEIAKCAREQGTDIVVGDKAYVSVCAYHYYKLTKGDKSV